MDDEGVDHCCGIDGRDLAEVIFDFIGNIGRMAFEVMLTDVVRIWGNCGFDFAAAAMRSMGTHRNRAVRTASLLATEVIENNDNKSRREGPH